MSGPDKMAARHFTDHKLVVATHNGGKVREFQQLFGTAVSLVAAGDLNLPEPEETGTTFAENAVLKARAAALASGLPALADDSGLAVTALGGAPGLYSARWAGPNKDFGAAMARVWDTLAPHSDKSAAFVCVLALVWPDGHSAVFEGRVDGDIIWPARGTGGFGYDPIFQPRGHNTTFAEMTPDAKKAISHRANAFKAMVDGCFPDLRVSSGTPT